MATYLHPSRDICKQNQPLGQIGRKKLRLAIRYERWEVACHSRSNAGAGPTRRAALAATSLDPTAPAKRALERSSRSNFPLRCNSSSWPSPPRRSSAGARRRVRAGFRRSEDRRGGGRRSSCESTWRGATPSQNPRYWFSNINKLSLSPRRQT